jgi:hypothetical protein
VSERGGVKKIERYHDQFSKHSSFFPKKKLKNPRGKVPNFVLPQTLFFCDLKTHAKFQNPTTTPSGRKASVGEEKERKKRKKCR